MLRIQNSCTMCTTALLVVFHRHIFLLQEPITARQREGRKLQKFPFSARRTVLKNHRGWRLLSCHTFQSCKEERSSWLDSFLLLPLLGSFNITVCPQASLQQGTLKAQRVSALLDAWSWMRPPSRFSTIIQPHLIHASKSRQRGDLEKPLPSQKNYASVPANLSLFFFLTVLHIFPNTLFDSSFPCWLISLVTCSNYFLSVTIFKNTNILFQNNLIVLLALLFRLCISSSTCLLMKVGLKPNFS